MHLSENYYHRKCYMKREQVPTQTVMKNVMGPMAPVYFKSMSPDLRVMAGLEPPLQGAGAEWCMPPEEILAGRHVLKPVNIKELKNLRYEGIMKLGELFRMRYFEHTVLAINQALIENNEKWKAEIIKTNNVQYSVSQLQEKENNSVKLRLTLQQFELMYRQAVTKVEELVIAASTKEIQRIRDDTFQHMEKHYTELLDYQARTLYDHYEKTFNEEKEALKQQFIKDVSNIRTDMGNTIRNIVRDKHESIEKLRHFLMCKNLACQVYVALKEKETCAKETDTVKKAYQKRVKTLRDDIAMKDYEIELSMEMRRKRQYIIRIWKRKVCHILKRFQMFVQYCLIQLPDQAQFFLDLEKLMLLQVSKALENPETESIIETESEIKTVIPRPHPFYVFCDRGYKPIFDRYLCPAHCTSSASEMPVIVINKRCFYTACDNYDKFTNKVTEYLLCQQDDDDDVFDDHNYEVDIPVKITKSQQLLQLKLESSIMQILQQELPNVRELPIECGSCKLPFCFCRTKSPHKHMFSQSTAPKEYPVPKEKPEREIVARAEELWFEREPKWESYFKFVQPCKCGKSAKKHLQEHLPPYMWKTSPFEPHDAPHYERCNLSTLKKLVKKSRGLATPPPTPPKQLSKTRTVGVQYSDTDFDILCNCLSDDELEKLYEKLAENISEFSDEAKETTCDVVDASARHSFLEQAPSSFTLARAYSLRRMLSPSVEELFVANDCHKYEDN